MATVHKNVKHEILTSQDKQRSVPHSQLERLQLGWKRTIQKEREIEIFKCFPSGLAPLDIKIYYKLTIVQIV